METWIIKTHKSAYKWVRNQELLMKKKNKKSVDNLSRKYIWESCQSSGQFVQRMKEKISSDKLSVVTVFPALLVTSNRKKMVPLTFPQVVTMV